MHIKAGYNGYAPEYSNSCRCGNGENAYDCETAAGHTRDNPTWFNDAWCNDPSVCACKMSGYSPYNPGGSATCRCGNGENAYDCA